MHLWVNTHTVYKAPSAVCCTLLSTPYALVGDYEHSVQCTVCVVHCPVHHMHWWVTMHTVYREQCTVGILHFSLQHMQWWVTMQRP